MLPELLINSPVPGVREKITTLKVELSEVGLELEIEAAELPAGLRKAGQFRVLIGSEIILCEAKEEKTKKVKILERGAEGSIKAAHIAGSAIYQIITAEGLKRYIGPVTANHAVIPAEGNVSAVITGNARVLLFAFDLAAEVIELELEHNLATYQVQVQAQENNAGVPGAPVEIAWEPAGENKIKITFPESLAAKTVYFVSIVG